MKSRNSSDGAGPLRAADLLEPHRGAVVARARRWVGDEAEDMAQEVLLKAHLRVHTLKNPEAALPWLLKIADRACLDRLRRRDPLGSEARRLDELDAPDDAPDGLQMAQRTQMSDCARGYVERLAPAHRLVLELHDVQGLSAGEIAQRLGISTGAAKIRLHRARANLRKMLVEACTFSQDERGVLVCDRKAPSGE